MRDLKFTLEGHLLSRDAYFAIFSIDQVKIHDRVYMVCICFKELLCHSIHITKEETYIREGACFQDFTKLSLQYYFKYAQINQPMCLRMSRESQKPRNYDLQGGG